MGILWIIVPIVMMLAGIIGLCYVQALISVDIALGRREGTVEACIFWNRTFRLISAAWGSLWILFLLSQQPGQSDIDIVTLTVVGAAISGSVVTPLVQTILRFHCPGTTFRSWNSSTIIHLGPRRKSHPRWIQSRF